MVSIGAVSVLLGGVGTVSASENNTETAAVVLPQSDPGGGGHLEP
jgi:hypothetical protein